MKNKFTIAVVGGGFAGISAAVNLIKSGHKVTLYEASKRLGGRAFSFTDPKSGLTYDNGQHLFMGCYTDTFSVLKEINAFNSISFLDPVTIHYQTSTYGRYSLRAKRVPAPFHLLYSFLVDLKPLSLKDRINLLILAVFLLFPSRQKLKEKTVSQWLSWWKQGENAKNYVWKIITESIMNADLNRLNAYTFRESIKILFLKSRKNIVPALSVVGLTELIEQDLISYFETHNAKLHLATTVSKLQKTGTAILLEAGNHQAEFDKVVLAIPHKNATKLEKFNFAAPRLSSILSIHFTSKKTLISEAFVGFPEQKIHWLFNKNRFSSRKENIYSAVVSNADSYLSFTQNQLRDLFLKEMKFLFPDNSPTDYLDIRIIHEKQATPILSPDYMRAVLKPSEVSEGIYVCGDWTDTGLPATIESASKSGKIISKIINKQ
jgi:squalene-associated FAD-dependent desaturase